MKNRVMMFTILAFIVTVVSGCASVTGRTAGELVDDSIITTEINAKIIKDSDLHYLKIDVSSFEGNVTLTGEVLTKEVEERLTRYAREVKGVKSVKSNLLIEEPK